jgi:hypothetical protein
LKRNFWRENFVDSESSNTNLFTKIVANKNNNQLFSSPTAGFQSNNGFFNQNSPLLQTQTQMNPFNQQQQQQNVPQLNQARQTLNTNGQMNRFESNYVMNSVPPLANAFNSPFNQNGFAIQPTQPTQQINPFNSIQPTSAVAALNQQSKPQIQQPLLTLENKGQLTNYSMLNDLKSQEIDEFKANNFTLGRIPINPPPHEMC